MYSVESLKCYFLDLKTTTNFFSVTFSDPAKLRDPGIVALIVTSNVFYCIWCWRPRWGGGYHINQIFKEQNIHTVTFQL